MIRSPNSNVFLNDFPKQNHSPSRKCLVTLKRRIWQTCTVSFKWRTKFYLDDFASQPALSVSCTAGYLASYLYSCHLRVPIQTPLNVLVTLFKLHGSRFFVISFFPRSHTETRQIFLFASYFFWRIKKDFLLFSSSFFCFLIFSKQQHEILYYTYYVRDDLSSKAWTMNFFAASESFGCGVSPASTSYCHTSATSYIVVDTSLLEY